MHSNREHMQPILAEYHILRSNLTHILPNWQASNDLNLIIHIPVTKVPLRIKISSKELQLWKETNQQLTHFITKKEGKPKMYQLLMNIHQLLFTLSKRLNNLITSEKGEQKIAIECLKSQINVAIEGVVKLSSKKSGGTQQKEGRRKINKQEQRQIIRRSRLSAAASPESIKLTRQSATNPSRNLSKMQSFMHESELVPLGTFTPQPQSRESQISWNNLNSTNQNFLSKSSKIQQTSKILRKSITKKTKKQLIKVKVHHKNAEKIGIFPGTTCISKQILPEEMPIQPILTVKPQELCLDVKKQQLSRQKHQRHPSIHQKCGNKVRFAEDVDFQSCIDIDANNLSNVTKAQINTRKGIVFLESIEIPKSLEQIDISTKKPTTDQKQIKIKPSLQKSRLKGNNQLLLAKAKRFQSKTTQCLRLSHKKDQPSDDQKDRWDTYAEICLTNACKFRQTNRQNDLCIPQGTNIQSALKELERFSLDLKEEVCRQPKCQQSIFFKQEQKIQANESRQMQYRLSAFEKQKRVRNEIFEIRSEGVTNKDLLYSQLDNQWIQQKYTCPPGLKQIQLK